MQFFFFLFKNVVVKTLFWLF